MIENQNQISLELTDTKILERISNFSFDVSNALKLGTNLRTRKISHCEDSIGEQSNYTKVCSEH